MVSVRNRHGSFALEPSILSQVSGPAKTKPEDLHKVQWPGDFCGSLVIMSSSAIKAANQSPHDFFYPWIDGIRRDIARLLIRKERALSPFHEFDELDEENLQEITSGAEWADFIIRANIANLRDYLNAHATSRTPAMLTALQDLESLQGRIESLRKRTDVLTNRLVSTLALKESRKSIEQSTSTKHLTQLAYIFLPLNLSTSVFGMNTVELQNTKLWVFFPTASVSLFTSLVLWLVIGWFSKPVNSKHLTRIGRKAITKFNSSWTRLFTIPE